VRQKDWNNVAFLPTHPALGRALTERNYDDPTPVQDAVLGTEAAGRDLLVSAQTGSGKTVAYGLAIAATLLGEDGHLARSKQPVALIVAPTRELALQVQRELAWLYQYAHARVVACVGGMDPQRERRVLADGADIVVGTPGRLRDHLERRGLDVTALKAVVLDEADEMLDLGFREDLEFILQSTPAERRTLLFSATLPKTIAMMAKRFQRDALRIEVKGDTRAHADIEYRAIRIAPNETEHAVVNVLRFVESPGALVFCNTRESVRHLHAILSERGFDAVSLSGELSQSERNHALQALRDGRARVCVATDVAARGIDLPSLGLVIHADLPHDSETLQHRSGRTGRAGRKGVSVLLVPPSKRRRAEGILMTAGIKPTWGPPPTADEIRKLDQERLLVDPILAPDGNEDDLVMARALLAERSAEEIAAALVRVYRSRLPSPEDVFDPGERGGPSRETRAPRDYSKPRDYSTRDMDAGDAGDARPPRAARPPRPERINPEPGGPDARQAQGGPMVWFRLDIGRNKNADPRWLLPLICRRGNITKQDIGAIKISDNDTKFEVVASIAERFAEATRGTGGEGNITPSEAPAGGGGKPRFGGASRSSGPSRSSSAPRSSAPRASAAPRSDADDKPVADKPFAGKPFAGKPRGDKPFGAKPFAGKPRDGKPGGYKPGGFKPGADKPRSGPRKPFHRGKGPASDAKRETRGKPGGA
jgi:ATP-dependent RNA helicase DeaD